MNRADSARSTDFGRGTALLTLGIGSSGALTYLYFALASHNLGAQSYGALVVLWSALFISVVTLYRPVEQLISRSVSERDELGRSYGRTLRLAATIQLVLAAAFVLAALLLREPIEDDLLDGEGFLYAVFVIAAPAYAVSFFARGWLAGRGWFGLYGAMLLLESTSRFSFAVIVALGIASGVSVVAVGILIAPLMSLLAVPLVALSSRAGPPPEVAADPGKGDPAGIPDVTDIDLASGGAFVGSAFLIMLSEQALLNAGVLIVGAAAGSAEAGLLFNILLLARAPQVLFMAVTTSLLPSLSRIRAGGGDAASGFDREVRRTLRYVVAFGASVAAVVAIAGPTLMEIVFGDGFEYDRVGLLMVAAGMTAHLCALTLTQAALARDRAASAAARWVGAALLFVVVCLLPALEEVRRVEIGYALATVLLATALAALYRSRGPRA